VGQKYKYIVGNTYYILFISKINPGFIFYILPGQDCGQVLCKTNLWEQCIEINQMRLVDESFT